MAAALRTLRQIGADEALAALVEPSQRENVKVRAYATGASPQASTEAALDVAPPEAGSAGR